MRDFADRDDIDVLAEKLFSKDHPERAWNPLDAGGKLDVAPAHVRAVYRGFARGRIERELAADVAAAALAHAAVNDQLSRKARRRV